MSAAMLTMAADNVDSRRRASLAMLSKNKPVVDIQLDDVQEDTCVPSFTTLEQIKGVATILSPVDTPYDGLHVTFQGSARTYVEKLATSAPTSPKRSAFHTFLRLSQPLNEEDLPDDKVLKADVSYRLSFTFVVPERLLPQACSHPTQHTSINEAHLALPPSLGDPMMAGDGKHLLDDMAPDNMRVSYGLRVFALKKMDESARPKMMFDSIKKVRIVPAVLEAPPLRVLDNRDDDYILSCTKTIKKGVFKGKLGSLTVNAAQPSPFFLRKPSSTDHSPVSAMANVNVRFEPAENSSKPPKLDTLICRLKVATFYGSKPMEVIPTRAHAFQYDSSRGIYVDTVPLSHRCIESVQWTRHEASARGSETSKTHSTPSMSDTAGKSKKKRSKKDQPDPKTLPFYTASVLLPILLPSTKSFVPTFHSCLISRLYLLDIVLAVLSSATASGLVSVSTTNLHLKSPIQIAARGNADARPVISAEEAASIARREADGYFLPRTISPLDSESASPVQIPESSRGARGSIFTPRWGSITEAGSGEEEDESEGPLPPRYTGYVRPGLIMTD